MPRGRPRKDDKDKFDAEVRARMFSKDKEFLQRAADSATRRRGGGGNLSDWMREMLLKAAREELGEDNVE